MSISWRAAVLLTAILAGVCGCVESNVISTLTEADLSSFVAKTELFVVLYLPDPCTSAECDNINELFPLVVQSVVPHNVKAAVVKNAVLMQKLGISKEPKLIFYRHGVPILFESSSIDVEDVVSWIEDNTKSFTLSLNDDSFEHETQASTGATTGDWFIRFYTADCSDATAVWEAVASRLRSRINVASVNLESNSKLEKRLQITRCPTFIFFRHGNMYIYELPVLTIESFVSFADGWYKNAPYRRVPAEPTPFDELTDSIVDLLKTTFDDGAVSLWPAIIVVSMVAAVLALCCLLLPRKQKSD